MMRLSQRACVHETVTLFTVLLCLILPSAQVEKKTENLHVRTTGFTFLPVGQTCAVDGVSGQLIGYMSNRHDGGGTAGCE